MLNKGASLPFLLSDQSTVSHQFQAVFRIRIQLNPDLANNLNPDPEDLESGTS